MKSYSETQLPSIPLDSSQLESDPFVQFDIWFKEARNRDCPMPHAMSLATSTANGITSLRTVLLKDYDHIGFVFFTNYWIVLSYALRTYVVYDYWLTNACVLLQYVYDIVFNCQMITNLCVTLLLFCDV